MFCQFCGKEIDDGQKFCPYCGKPVEASGSQQSAMQQPHMGNAPQMNMGQQQQQAQFTPQYQYNQQPPKKKKKIWPIILIVVVVIIIIIAIAASSGDDSSDGGSSSSVYSSSSGKEVDLSSPESIYEFLQDNDVIPYQMSDKSKKFIKEHSDLFPASGDIDSDLIDESINYRQILKNSDDFGDKLMTIPAAYVVQIDETKMANDKYFTDINISDGDQQYYVLYIGKLKTVFEDHYVSVYGLPLGTGNFENTDGGSTNAVVLAGAQVTDLGTDSDDSSSSDNSTSDNATVENTSTDDGDFSSEFILPYSDSEVEDGGDIESLSDTDLRIAINEIYARHGYHFKSSDLQDYFNATDWYTDEGITDQSQIKDEMNDYEKENLENLTAERSARQ